MANLKDLRTRINSVKSTRKITSAMKMVSAAKLKRAQQRAEAARPYAQRMERMLISLGEAVMGMPGAPKLLVGTGDDKVHLLVVITSDRGLAGAFNSGLGRFARAEIRRLEAEGKTVKILAVGRKGRDFLRREFADRFVGDISFMGRKTFEFADAQMIADKMIEAVGDGKFDVCTLIYNRFASVISQVPSTQQLIPAPLPANENKPESGAVYEFEPSEHDILATLLPRNLAVQIFSAMLESIAGEHGARMTAMDNATRNAGDMINRLTLVYNRTRQANITKELIEIISGAEAV